MPVGYQPYSLIQVWKTMLFMFTLTYCLIWVFHGMLKKLWVLTARMRLSSLVSCWAYHWFHRFLLPDQTCKRGVSLKKRSSPLSTLLLWSFKTQLALFPKSWMISLPFLVSFSKALYLESHFLPLKMYVILGARSPNGTTDKRIWGAHGKLSSFFRTQFPRMDPLRKLVEHLIVFFFTKWNTLNRCHRLPRRWY